MLWWTIRFRIEISLSRFSSSLAVSLLRTTALMATGACVSCSWRDWRCGQMSSQSVAPQISTSCIHRVPLGER